MPQPLGGAGDQLDLGGIGQVVALHVDGAVPIEHDDAPPAAGVAVRSGSRGAVLDHAVLATARHSSSLSHTRWTWARVNPTNVGRLMPVRAIASATGKRSPDVASA